REPADVDLVEREDVNGSARKQAATPDECVGLLPAAKHLRGRLEVLVPGTHRLGDRLRVGSPVMHRGFLECEKVQVTKVGKVAYRGEPPGAPAPNKDVPGADPHHPIVGS